jgi:hypothetical protein
VLLVSLAAGEGITLYILLKTQDQEIINRKVPPCRQLVLLSNVSNLPALFDQIAGAEASIRTSDTGIVSSLDQVIDFSLKSPSSHLPPPPDDEQDVQSSELQADGFIDCDSEYRHLG